MKPKMVEWIVRDQRMIIVRSIFKLRNRCLEERSALPWWRFLQRRELRLQAEVFESFLNGFTSEEIAQAKVGGA